MAHSYINRCQTLIFSLFFRQARPKRGILTMRISNHFALPFASRAVSQVTNDCAAQHWGQLLMFEGQSCSFPILHIFGEGRACKSSCARKGNLLVGKHASSGSLDTREACRFLLRAGKVLAPEKLLHEKTKSSSHGTC